MCIILYMFIRVFMQCELIPLLHRRKVQETHDKSRNISDKKKPKFNNINLGFFAFNF
jgi:hypothetical protein